MTASTEGECVFLLLLQNEWKIETMVHIYSPRLLVFRALGTVFLHQGPERREGEKQTQRLKYCLIF